MNEQSVRVGTWVCACMCVNGCVCEHGSVGACAGAQAFATGCLIGWGEIILPYSWDLQFCFHAKSFSASFLFYILDFATILF